MFDILQLSPSLRRKAYLDLDEVVSCPRTFWKALSEVVVMELKCCAAVQIHMVEVQRRSHNR